jgi:NTP pyrophosphatase (non-canonical NTP hydrolase)
MKLPDLPWWRRTDPRNDIPVPWHCDPFIEGGSDQERLIRQALSLLCAEAHRNARDHGFWFAKTPEGRACECIALMHSELSEALEAYRAGRMQATTREATEEETKRTGAAHVVEEGALEELADCLIRICDFCGAAQLDLGDAVLLKMQRNRERPGLHGKRF